MTTTTPTAPDLTTLVSAIEDRNSDELVRWYAPDATLTILDRDHPPAAPLVFRGSSQIRDYYRDICGRNIAHRVSDAVATDRTLAFVQHCTYPEGGQVVCVTVAELQDQLILAQTAVQAWDA